ncbi:beta-lactamase [hydrocarbon metagenome]|uniref:Beta-lactamase n=1 Tax=hydrocarbon metagenome TaxID=938273 RepID=A0A0W8FV69_9ZZZZ
MKRIFLINLFFLGFFLVSPGCTTLKIMWYQSSEPDDYKLFDTRTIHKGGTNSTFSFKTSDKAVAKIESLILFPKGDKNNNLSEKPPLSMSEFLNMTKTNAFLVIRNDTILYEQYFNGYDKNSISNSMSMGKAVTSSLVGIALKEGHIKSLDDPIVQYLPDLKNIKGFEKIRIIHLLQMTSGIKFTENYNWLSDAAYLYYTSDRRKFFSQLEIESEPGIVWKYKSIDTALLSLILFQATNKTVSAYAEEKLWCPLGMESDALWGLDSKESGIEKTSCCLYATARDFAKFGRLYANKGNWFGNEIIDPWFFNYSTQIDESEGSVWDYQFKWWMPWWMGQINDPFYAHGYKGQRLMISPSKQIIVVKLSNDTQADKNNKEYYMEMMKVIFENL